MSVAGKIVLVTGADGFIGSHLVERLVADGAKVRAFCMYNSQGSWGWLDTSTRDVKAALDVRLGDIRDPGFVADATKGVDVVMHLAALIAIPYSYNAPESFVATNVHGTLNVLEAARRHGVQRLIVTSTSEVYGTPETTPIRETHALNAQSPYAATKVAADQLSLSFQRSFGVPVVILRPFNTYGPRQSMRAVLPTILGQLLKGSSTIKLGRLDTRRDLTFVADTVDGFVRAAIAQGIEGKTIQLGTGKSPSIQDVFDTACRVLGKQAKVELDNARLRPDASEVLVLESDYAQATALLGWRPTVELEEGLRRHAEWMAQNLDRYDTERFHV
ncbi:MAG TPA: SDR family NAD(P)-dependent oxidoreductase [Kofleriaceae bacterium]|nr:SDR family NAD(P)-dependent oxidoreductase [Kofleriaceae bacterium]